MNKVFIYFSLWVLAINVYALLALNRFNLKPDTAYIWMRPRQYQQPQGWGFIDMHARWDSRWYLDIAKNGYSYKGPNLKSNLAFFPVYPFLIKLFSLPLFNNYILAGWIVSLIFLYLSLILIYKLCKEFHKNIDPLSVICFLLIFPLSLFFNAVYAESVFLFFTLGVFYYWFKKRYLEVAIFGYLAALTRITGILLFFPLLWEYINHNGIKIRKSLLSIAAIPGGLFSYFLYHYYTYGDFFLFLKVQKSWGRIFGISWDKLTLTTNPSIVNFALDLSYLIFGIVITILTFKRLRTSYAIYSLLTIALGVATGSLLGIGRFISIIFPIFIYLATIKNVYLKKLYIFSSILLLALNLILFANNYWPGG